MIIRNDIPILEYDTSSPEVIAPDHDNPEMRLPEMCVLAFLGDVVDAYALEHDAEVADEFITVSHSFPMYVLHDPDMALIQVPIGAPAAAQVIDVAIGHGCRKIIAVGSCGVLTDIEENAFLVPVKALRDEGTSYHYLPAARTIEPDAQAVTAIESLFKDLGLPFEECLTWTTDGFFRETKDMVAARVQEGYTCVEMECATLCAVAQKRGARFGEFFFTADSLANLHEYDARGFGYGAHEKAVELAIRRAEDWKKNEN